MPTMNKRSTFTLAVLATVLSLLISCSAAPQSPEAFANRFIEAENKAWTTGDLSDLKALEADDIVYHLPGMDVKGWEGHEAYIKQGRAMVSNLKQDWKYLAGEGNLFVLSYDATGDFPVDPAKPAVTAPTTSNFLAVFRIENGKIAEGWMNGTSTAAPVAEANKP